MSRKVYEHRFEITLVDHGVKKTQENQVKFTGDDPKEFIRVVKPIIDRAFETWARDVEKSRTSHSFSEPSIVGTGTNPNA